MAVQTNDGAEDPPGLRTRYLPTVHSHGKASQHGSPLQSLRPDRAARPSDTDRAHKDTDDSPLNSLGKAIVDPVLSSQPTTPADAVHDHRHPAEKKH